MANDNSSARTNQGETAASSKQKNYSKFTRDA